VATVKHGSTKKINRLINYCEKRAEITSTNNLMAEDKRSIQHQMKFTRESFDKTGGVEGHHFIQSFKPGEVTPEKANELGLELAKKMHPDREAVIYTHTDKGHIHNHIVLNSPSIEDGKKLSVTKKHYYDWQRQNDAICKENGLSIVEKKEKKVNKSLAEFHMNEKNVVSFKEYLRQTIDKAKEVAMNFKEMQVYLKEKYFVESKKENDLYYFKAPNMNRFMSGKRLGNDYSKEVLEREFRSNERGYDTKLQREREQQREREAEQSERAKRQRELAESRATNERIGKNIGLGSDGNKRNESRNELPQLGQQKVLGTNERPLQSNQRKLQKNIVGVEQSKPTGNDNQSGKSNINERTINTDRPTATRNRSERNRDGGLEL